MDLRFRARDGRCVLNPERKKDVVAITCIINEQIDNIKVDMSSFEVRSGDPCDLIVSVYSSLVEVHDLVMMCDVNLY